MPPSPIQVLIVDDSEVIRRHFVERLNRLQGVRVVGEAQDTPSAVRAFHQLHPDVVLLDIQMPGQSGIVALEFIHAHDPEAHVFMLTNHAHPLYRERCLNAGARHFFDKSTECEYVEGVLSQLAHART